MNETIKKIAEAGIKTDENKKSSIHAEPEFRGNFGFYHVTSGEWELVFIKGVFRDNIISLKGECAITDRKQNELAQMLSDIERCLRRPASVEIAFEDDSFYAVSADTTDMPPEGADMRDIVIETPMTPVEMSLGKSDGAGSKNLFSKNPFVSVFGETLSPFMFSVCAAMPDAMNPLFMSAEIKTLSPSVKTFFGRAFLNITSLETVMSAFYVRPDFLYLNFLPLIYKTTNKPTIAIPKLSIMRLADTEADQGIKDAREAFEQLTLEDLFSQSFLETAGLTVMTFEMIYLSLWQSFAKLHHALGQDVETTLRHIYKTYDCGLLKEGREIMPYVDPACSPVRLKPVQLDTVAPEAMYKTLSGAKRLLLSKAKYAALLAEVHNALSKRDEMTLLLSDFTLKVRKLLLAEGRKLVENSILEKETDIFYFDLKELENITKDEFFGNIPFTLNFRRWQNWRFGAACVPNYLFEKDVENTIDIASRQINKSVEEHSVPCMAFFNKNMQTDNYICKNGFTAADINQAAGKDAVVAESASLFSYIMQYCAATDTPLYTGVRFAPVILKDKPIKTSADAITF